MVYVPVGVPVTWQDATVALPALSESLPTLRVAAKPYTAPKIVRARTTANSVRFFASALLP